MWKIPLFLVAAGLLLAPALFAGAQEASSELSITRTGKVTIKGAKVFQLAGPNLFIRLYWKNVFLRATVLTNPQTSITKRYGEKAAVADIKEGDILDVEGVFPSSSETFIVQAASIKDYSLEKQSFTVAGTVTGTDPLRDEFKMTTSRGTPITVVATAADMKKGVIPVGVFQLKAGDKITSASGIYDFSVKVLTASTIRVHQDQSVFVPHNFQGTIKSISGSAFPLEMVVGLTAKDYTVMLTEKTKLLKANGAPTTLSRFLVGDQVRFYGAVRRDDLSKVDNVSVMRNLDL